jgi:hypothetical protein
MELAKLGKLIKDLLEMEVINMYVLNAVKIIIVVLQNVYQEKIIVEHT